MNEHVGGNELPELSDEDVELLYAICKRASHSTYPPFRALFAAYDHVFAEQQIQQHHDGVVFRFLMRVGESTRSANRQGQAVDLVQRLRAVLEAQGITVVAPSDDGAEDESPEPATLHNPPSKKDSLSPRRRVSFDDARLEETWLSEHSMSISSPLHLPPTRLMGLPPRREATAVPVRRSRSTSSQRAIPLRSAAPTPVHESALEAEEPFNQSLLFDPSQTQLELNAEAFASTSAIRSMRRALHLWYHAMLRARTAHWQAHSAAISHDRATLLAQAIGQWRSAVVDKVEERNRLGQLKWLEERAIRYRHLYLLTKAFTHWATSSSIERIRTAVAKRHVLKITYFKKWRAIASANQMKVRRILAAKYLAMWREKTARRLLAHEQAVAHCEERLMRKYKKVWFWKFCNRRVQAWHEETVERRAFARLKDALNSHRRLDNQADDLFDAALARKSIQVLQNRLNVLRRLRIAAQRQHDQSSLSKILRNLRTQVTLAPISRRITAKANLDLERATLRLWHMRSALSHQASEVHHKRILQTAWTSWNDALRCRALAQKIDERVVVENLYRWVLQERLALYQRNLDRKLLRRALAWCVSKIQGDRDILAEAEVIFAERQRRSRLAYGMLQLNLELRNREDAERLAVEARNSRMLPKIVDSWIARTQNCRKRAKEAGDARFYFLCTSTLKLWQAKTGEHKQHRRRDAYTRIRARVKIKLVSHCFTRWRSRAAEVQSMDAEAERRARSRIVTIGTDAFHRWRERSVNLLELNLQAAHTDHQRLVGSAFSALSSKHSDLATAEQNAWKLRRGTDYALMGGALKSMQWATFTATRRLESAEALWTRNRDQHVRHMLRHWAAQVVAQRNAANAEGDTTVLDEPESPSIRPGSRAASRSAGRSLPSSPPAAHSTPAYLRTPSRPRRGGRFRPLPTPAHLTPMAFNSAYLVTTPAPLIDAGSLGGSQSLIGLTPQVTPFQRKLRAGGFAVAPPSALRSIPGPDASAYMTGGTSKSVRFAGTSSRFGTRGGDDHDHEKTKS